MMQKSTIRNIFLLLIAFITISSINLISLPKLSLIASDDKIEGGLDDEMAFHATLKNISFFDPVTVKLKINVTEIQKGQGLLVCWGETCYPTVTKTGAITFMDPYTLAAQQESGQNFKCGIEQGGVTGKIVVTFTFFDQSNPSDEASFTSEANVTATGIEYFSDAKFLMYPMPAPEMLNIDFAGENYQSLSVINMTGAVVLSQSISVGVNALALNTSELSQGVYQLNLMRADGMFETRKIVISR
jgi:hypothetical protein